MSQLIMVNNEKILIALRTFALSVAVTLVFISLIAIARASDEVKIGEWHFDGDAQDSSGHGNHGTVKGAIFVDGKIGQSLSFNGKNQNVIIPDAPYLNITTPFFIVLWIKLASRVTEQSSIYPMILEKGDGTWSGRNYGIYLDTNKDLLVFNAAKSDKTAYAFHVKVRASTYLDDLNWHKITATWDGNLASLSIDDAEVKKASGSGSLYTNSNPLAIGGNGLLDWFNGYVNDVKISGTSFPSKPRILIDGGGKTIQRKHIKITIPDDSGFDFEKSNFIDDLDYAYEWYSDLIGSKPYNPSSSDSKINPYRQTFT